MNDLPAARLGELLASLRAGFASEPDPGRRVERVALALGEAVTRPDLLDDRACAPPPPGDAYARNLLWHDPDHGFAMLALVWPPGARTPIHDHGGWGVVSVVSGSIRFTSYQRLDDGSVEGRADLRETLRVDGGPGALVRAVPPYDEIHRLENPGETTSITLHVYEGEIETCRAFDPEAGTWRWIRLRYSSRLDHRSRASLGR